MTKKNPFFLIGTLGMLITSMCNILLESFNTEIISSLSMLYPVFILFLLIGAGIMIKKDHSHQHINS